MATIIVQWIFMCTCIYLICGLLFSLYLINKGLKVLDESSHDAGICFKLIIIPGCMVFWPVLLNKYRKAKKEMIIDRAKE